MAAREITCLHCGIQFQQTGRGRPRKYCSSQCLWTAKNRASGARPIDEANAQRRKAAQVFCEKCGVGFIKRNGTNAWRFCSRVCAGTAKKVRVAQAWKCVDCDAALPRRALRCGPCAKERNRLAALEAAKRKHSAGPRDCKECGQAFVPVYGEKNRTYCSAECRHRSCKRIARLKGKARKRAATVEPVNANRVFIRDGWRCHLCGGMTDRTKRGTLHPNAPELDHIVPLSKGGEHSYRNTACAHKRCNAAKSDRIIGQPSLLAA